MVLFVFIFLQQPQETNTAAERSSSEGTKAAEVLVMDSDPEPTSPELGAASAPTTAFSSTFET